MSKLTDKQRIFCEEYVANFGNGTQAAIKAGYSKNSAAEISNENLRKPQIQKYIKKLSENADNERLMSVEEALRLSAAIARGEPQQFIFQELDGDTGEMITNEKKIASAGFKERVQSLEHILKVHGAFIDKKELSGKIELPIFVDDVPGDDDG